MKSNPVRTDEVVVNKDGGISFGLIKKVQDSRELPLEQMLDRLSVLKNQIDETYFEIGGMLKGIYDNKLYDKWGYADWQTFVEDKLGFSKRKAQYLMAIWHYFAVEINDEETIRKISQLGWSKAKELLGVVTSKNVDDWVKKAATSTVHELNQKITDAVMGSKTYEKSGKLVNFKLFAEQLQNVEDAINLAKGISGSDIRSNNLSLICLEYLSNNGGLDAKDPVKKAEIVNNSLKNIGITLGVKIVGIDALSGEVIYGKEYVADSDEDKS